MKLQKIAISSHYGLRFLAAVDIWIIIDYLSAGGFRFSFYANVLITLIFLVSILFPILWLQRKCIKTIYLVFSILASERIIFYSVGVFHSALRNSRFSDEVIFMGSLYLLLVGHGLLVFCSQSQIATGNLKGEG